MTPASPPRPSDLPPPPRETEWVSFGARLSVWFPRIFILPHALAGVGFLLVMLGSLLWLLLGQNLEADVLRTLSTRSKGRELCSAQWEYLRGGERHGGTSSIACARREALSRPGAVVRVRALHLGRWGHAALWGPGEGVEVLVFPWIFGVLWNGILGVFIWQLYVAPERQRRLVANGLFVEGTITRKDEVRGRGARLLLEYRYHPPGSAPQTGSITVADRPRWEKAQEGAPLRVLYAPDLPARSVAYDYCPYRVRGLSEGA